MIRVGIYSTVFAMIVLVGCAAFGGGQKMGESPGSQPAGEQVQVNQTQQAGVGNVAANLATTLKGIEYNSVLPAGLAVLLVFQMLLNGFGTWLSHRREVMRIIQTKG
jgi:hypothetical protein